MATTTTTSAAAAVPTASVTIADKLDMSLDDLAKLQKKEKREKYQEEQKKRQAEAAAKKAAAPAKKAPGSASTTSQQQPRGQQQQQQKKSSTAGGGAQKQGGGRQQQQQQSGSKTEGNTSRSSSIQASDKAPITTGTPVIIANLKEGIDLEELKEIFQTVGALKSAESLPFNGKWHAAKVIYKLKVDAEKAVKEFNGRLLDERPMKVTLGRKRIELGESKPSTSGRGGGGSQQVSGGAQQQQPAKRQRQ